MKKFTEIYNECPEKVQEILTFIFEKHDIGVNQKYGDSELGLPYSFHLKRVVEETYNNCVLLGIDIKLIHNVYVPAAAGHDLIEDARMTYNDVMALMGRLVADIIFSCTECRGRTRNERHSKEFFDTLLECEEGIIVKLSDITANVKFSLLTQSTMYKKYKKEFKHNKELFYSTETNKPKINKNIIIDRLEILLSL